MTWMGPTYAAWAGTVADMDEVVRRANDQTEVARQWREYAKKLEGVVAEVNEMYRNKAGESKGHVALKEAALKELERFDPTNKLLDPAYRKALFDPIKQATIESLKKK